MLVFQVGFTQSKFQDLFNGYKGVYDNIQPRPPDLKVRSDQSIGHIGKNLLKSNNIGIT